FNLHVYHTLLLFHFTLLFFIHAPATSEIYTLSLHDALPIYGLEEARDDLLDQHAGLDQRVGVGLGENAALAADLVQAHARVHHRDRKSTRLNSSHVSISYAVFCLKKKNSQHLY